ncbi:hypothetical protein G9A89_016808 [Geosiphon pyriformis]|nr:hypothetical protein G9A89_016808 [Geosiphon pyriformis]
MAPQQFFHALSNDFGNLLDSQKFSDVKIVVGEAPNIRTFHAHSPILAARSPYFALALSKESEIWEKIVEWGVAKLDNNIQMKNVLYWTDENFNAFKESIGRLLPLIRFFNIYSVDFYHKVKPFARILPGTLYEDLLHHYLVPGSHQKFIDAQPMRFSRSNIDSKLLRSHNIRQLDHWIQGKDENTPFENQLENDFQLLLRGVTVSVIKVEGTGQVIGGYNPQSWHFQNKEIDGKASLIFSLGDGKAGNSKLSKFVGKLGPFGGPISGPQFHFDIYVVGKDFKNCPGCYCKKTAHYEHAIIPGSENQRVNFFIEEYDQNIL